MNSVLRQHTSSIRMEALKPCLVLLQDLVRTGLDIVGHGCRFVFPDNAHFDYRLISEALNAFTA